MTGCTSDPAAAGTGILLDIRSQVYAEESDGRAVEKIASRPARDVLHPHSRPRPSPKTFRGKHDASMKMSPENLRVLTTEAPANESVCIRAMRY